jgi:hypothetical protein
MEDGKISGNTASGNGGGVYNSYSSNTYYGTFTMTGGEISGNTTNGSGGGVYNFGAFTKTSGIIYGSNEASSALKNTALNGYGHAVYSIVDDVSRERNSTAGTGVNLDSSTEENWGE